MTSKKARNRGTYGSSARQRSIKKWDEKHGKTIKKWIDMSIDKSVQAEVLKIIEREKLNEVIYRIN